MKLLKAWLAGAATMAILGGLFHAVLAGNYLMSQLPSGATMPTPPLPLLFILPVSLIMAYLYPKGYEGGTPATEGFRFGALIGIIMVLPLSVLFVGMFGVGVGAALIDVPWHLIEEGATGAVIALTYGNLKS